MADGGRGESGGKRRKLLAWSCYRFDGKWGAVARFTVTLKNPNPRREGGRRGGRGGRGDMAWVEALGTAGGSR